MQNTDRRTQMNADKTEPAIRPATPADAAICGPICYEAFKAISAAHNFPPDFPNADATTAILSMMFSTEGLYGVVAERGGRIVGSNVLDERAIIHGVGPITVDPAAQNSAVGRALMRAVMQRAREQGAAASVWFRQPSITGRYRFMPRSASISASLWRACGAEPESGILPGAPYVPRLLRTCPPAPISPCAFTDSSVRVSCRCRSATAPGWWSAKDASRATAAASPSSDTQPRKRTSTCRR